MTRNEYEAALVTKGVPPVLAYMAAENMNENLYEDTNYTVDHSASDLIWSGFVWSETDQGHAFWRAVADSAEAEAD